MPRNEIFECALRAAAAVTGVLRRGAAAGVTAGALVAAGCEAPPAPSTPTNPGATTVVREAPPAPAPPTNPGATTVVREAPPAPSPPTNPGATTVVGAAPAIDAGPPDACEHSENWGACCKAARAAHQTPASCMAWGPPAPPAYRGEVLA